MNLVTACPSFTFPKPNSSSHISSSSNSHLIPTSASSVHLYDLFKYIYNMEQINNWNNRQIDNSTTTQTHGL